MQVSLDIIEAFFGSEMGVRLSEAFPFGTLHRANFPRMQAWQERYHPIVKHRTPKKRKRRGH